MSNYATIKVKEGLARISREHPDLDFSASSPALSMAESRLNELVYLYPRSRDVTEKQLRDAFGDYERELKAANQRGLFAVV